MALSNTKILFSDCAEAWEYIQGKGKQTKNNLKLIMLYVLLVTHLTRLGSNPTCISHSS